MLESRIKQLLENKELVPQIEARMAEFSRGRDWQELFSELCFCILTANYTAEGGMRIQQKLGFNGFYKGGYDELAQKLAANGHRFPNARADYIIDARKVAKDLPRVYDFKGKDARIWLQGVKGLGMKEASHFLRNIGFTDVAILDRHILGLLAEHDLILKMPKNMSRPQYLETEKVMEGLSDRTGLDLARLDLYMWYLKTGKLLK